MKIYDAAVIGSGPAGLTAALYLARSGCATVLFEHMTAGGQLLATENLENYPGFPNGVKGYELADLMEAQLSELKIEKHRGEVSRLAGEAGAFTLLADDETLMAKTVLVCTGAKHRHLGLPREDELIGRGVSYCAICDGGFFRNQDVAVVGGGNSAMEEALYLAKLARKVHLIHRRSDFRGARIFLDKLENMPEKVEIHRDTIVTELLGEKDLQGLVLENLKSGDRSRLDVQGLFIYVGFLPQTTFLPEDVKKDGQGFIITDTEMRTNVPGIFAAGDIRAKLCRQVVTAAGDGATAAQAAFIFLEEMHA